MNSTFSDGFPDGHAHDKALAHLMNDFGDCTSGTGTRHYAGIVDKVLEFGTQEAQSLAGSMCLDIASRLETLDRDRDHHLEKAAAIWGQLVDRHLNAGTARSVTLRAGVGMACLKAYTSIICERTLPDTGIQDQMYRDLCAVAFRATELQAIFTQQDEAAEAREATAITAELAVNLLHQRWTRRNLPDSMLILPAHVSEDQGLNGTQSATRTKWDSSIFAEYPPTPPEVVVKVQTKSRANHKSSEYSKDIVVVNVGEDLAVTYQETRKNKKYGVRPRTIIQELVDEKSNPEVATRLDERTELLLDKIDE